jgi:hypothetical protein
LWGGKGGGRVGGKGGGGGRGEKWPKPSMHIWIIKKKRFCEKNEYASNNSEKNSYIFKIYCTVSKGKLIFLK